LNTILIVFGGFVPVQEYCTLEQAPAAIAKIRALWPSLFNNPEKLTVEFGPENLAPGQTRQKLTLEGKPIQAAE
jgi:hypothetical protein